MPGCVRMGVLIGVPGCVRMGVLIGVPGCGCADRCAWLWVC